MLFGGRLWAGLSQSSATCDGDERLQLNISLRSSLGVSAPYAFRSDRTIGLGMRAVSRCPSPQSVRCCGHYCRAFALNKRPLKDGVGTGQEHAYAMGK